MAVNRRKLGRLCPVVPDRLDLRDRPYTPRVEKSPKPFIDPRDFKPDRKVVPFRTRNQEQTNACTGFALAALIEHLSYRDRRNEHVSPWMLYSMARRYDEFRGSGDEGSSLRGALKGWYKHGACTPPCGRATTCPRPPTIRRRDWWLDAAKRPLGAYYRVDVRSVTDMQSALNEAGVLYASAVCHKGWDAAPSGKDRRRAYRIPCEKADPDDGGHAFAILGYDPYGFWILNSWGTNWGTQGLAVLSYEDWLENAMDCWVAQLGVATSLHQEVAAASTLRTSREHGAVRVSLASETVLRNREISPFVVNMANNGRLSGSGEFRTFELDLQALVTHHLRGVPRQARHRRRRDRGHRDLCPRRADERGDAAATAARWIPALYESKVFPIFFMWETDLWSTLKNRCQDVVASFREGAARARAGSGRACGGCGTSAWSGRWLPSAAGSGTR